MKTHNLYYLAVVLAAVGCKGTQEDQDKQEKTSKPNIIYIMADDLGYGDVGCYGQEVIQTPNIDQMAEQGIKFTQHYAANTVSAPSRCGLMTGMHMGHAEVRGNMEVDPSGQMPISDSTVTVAEMLKKAGYTTAMIGKWGLGVENTSGEPNKQGFDFYYGYLDQVLAHNYYPEYLLRNGKKEYLDNEVQYLDPDAWHDGLESYSTKKVDYSHDLFTKEALNYLEDKQDTTFFLYLPYTIPHNNGGAPEGRKQEVPDMGIYADKDWPHDRKGYAAMITRMDKDIGRLMGKLKKLGLEKNTLVVFTSDNGPMKESHGFTRFFDSNGPFRGGKRDLYEGGIRVPHIAKWPGKIKAGRTTDHLSAFWDFFPTACEVAGIEPPEYVDGISYLPELLGKKQPKHEYLYWEFPAAGGKQAIRKGKWKAIRNNLYDNPEAPVELYNLKKDVAESDNIAEQHPEKVEEMKKLMEEARTYDPNWKLLKER
jgi:arylsulfatase A-like enzyme